MQKNYVSVYHTVKAVQFLDDPHVIEQLSNFVENQPIRVTYKDPNRPRLILESNDVESVANVGDYVIKMNEEYYVCPQQLFNEIYMEVF